LFQHGVVALLGFGWRYVADGLQEPSVVEPVDPFEGGELDGLEVPPWSAPVDQLGLVKTVDGFGEGPRSSRNVQNNSSVSNEQKPRVMRGLFLFGVLFF